MPKPQESITINLPPSLRDRSRGKKAGTRAKVSIEITSEPVVALMDMASVTEAAANAVADELRERVVGFSREASDATKERRQRYSREHKAGRKTAVKRYSGSKRSKLGPMPPKDGATGWYNDSGRLAKGIVAKFNRFAGVDGGWTVNVAQNRLNAQEFGPQHFEQFAAMFDSDIVNQNGKHAAETKRYRDAIDASLPSVIAKLKEVNAAKRSELRRLYGTIVQQGVRAAMGF